MAGRIDKMNAHVARWADTGLIDAATADALRADLARNTPRGIGFATVFALMAGALFAASILIFIAANWEVMPRLWRVGLIVGLILVSYVGGAILRNRGSDAFGEAAFIVGAATFGAGIALVGQMYHLSGDERQAILAWYAGTLVAAILLRSWPLTAGAALLSGAWLATGIGGSTTLDDLPHAWLALAALTWAVSIWTRSALTRHLLSFMLIGYLLTVYATEEISALPYLVAAAGIVMVAFARLAPVAMRRMAGLGDGLYAHGFLYFLAGMALLHAELFDEPTFMLPPFLTFAGIVAAVVIAGGESPVLRRLAYAAFAVEITYLYAVMLGTMVNTAGFFLVIGLLLAGLAFVATRIEKRMARTTLPEAAA